MPVALFSPPGGLQRRTSKRPRNVPVVQERVALLDVLAVHRRPEAEQAEEVAREREHDNPSLVQPPSGGLVAGAPLAHVSDELRTGEGGTRRKGSAHSALSDGPRV